jgi:GNAT superfamily N-acetyltransferase
MANIRVIEELSLNAWPSLQTVHLDGWLVRLANGYTRRANSVQPLYPASESGVDIRERIAYCEALYAHHLRQPAVFKMTGAALPKELDDVLAARGYRREAETSVQTLDLASWRRMGAAGAPIPEGMRVVIRPDVTVEWLTAYSEMSGTAMRHRETHGRMLRCILAPAVGFAAVLCGDETVAVGLGVAERGHVGLFDIVTAPERRREGIGRLVVASLLDWGHGLGAQRAYLNVMRENEAALRLYAAHGFVEEYVYWYRVQPDVPPNHV